MKNREVVYHNNTFYKGDVVFFFGSNEGPFLVLETKTISDCLDSETGTSPRDGVGHHQHVTINEVEGTSSEGVYSGAWLYKKS